MRAYYSSGFSSCVLAVVLSACSGGGGSASDADSDSSTLTGSGTSTSTATSTSTTSDSGSGTSAGSTSGSGTSSTTGSTTDGSTSGVIFDVGGEGTTTGAGCGGDTGGGDVEFSYIWIANSPGGTVSKIDTQTLQEVGRYQVRPQGGGQPSRTSVSLDGDVVVASRDGGVTKIFAKAEDCVDDNGTPGIQTSTGKADVLAWDEEECVAWYTDYSFASERAIAWTAGELNEATCKQDGAKVWMGATSDQVNLEIKRLDGDTGVEEMAVQIPGTTGFMSRSPYGGAVDEDGDFWAVNGYCDASLVEVRFSDFTYDVLQIPQGLCAYGIAVDSKGFVWIGGYTTISARYDPMTQTWDTVQAQGLGIQEDAQGRLWLGAYQQNGVYSIDGDTLQVLDYVDLPTTGQSKGISIDFYGYVWVVSDGGTTAVRYDPDSKTYDLYEGLDQPYSYSDMTGWGLKNVAGPQG